MAKRRDEAPIPAPQWSPDEKLKEAEAKLQEAETRLAGASLRVNTLEESLAQMKAEAKDFGDSLEKDRLDLSRSLEAERDRNVALEESLKEARTALEDHKASLGKVATHRDQLAAENVDLQRALAKAKASAQETEGGKDAQAKEAQGLRDLLAKERAEGQKALEALKAKLHESSGLQERLEKLQKEHVALRSLYDRRSSETVGSGVAVTGQSVSVPGQGVFLDEKGLKEISRILPRTHTNMKVLAILGLS